MRHAGTMRTLFMLTLAAGVASSLEGCASATIGQVQEAQAEPGTYTIGVSKGSGIVSDTTKAISAAVDKAGDYCHKKGQKLLLKSAVGSTIVFRCVAGDPNL
jgi:hypothetical protein